MTGSILKIVGILILTLPLHLPLHAAELSFIPNVLPDEAVSGEYLVKLRNKEAKALSFQNIGRVLGGVVRGRVNGDPSTILISTDKSVDRAISEFFENGFVEFAEPNYIYTIDNIPNDPDFDKSWGLKNFGDKRNPFQIGFAHVDIHAEEAWDTTVGSRDVVVAVIDTGIDLTHPDLSSNLWVNEKELDGKPGVDDDGNGLIDDVYGYDFYNNAPSPQDDNGHGSNIAGIIGASGNNGVGLTGVNWNIKIMAIKALSEKGAGNILSLVNAIDYASKMGAKVCNISWGGRIASQALISAVKRAEARGMLIVASAGNLGQDTDVVGHYPASFDLPNIISVTAVDNEGSLPSFASFGARSVDVAAPGVNILSTYNDGGYEIMSGSSQAAPFVTGIAGLALSREPLSVAELKKRILSSVDSLPSLTGKTLTGGLVDAAKVVNP